MSDAKQKKLIVIGAFAFGVLVVLVGGYLMLISPSVRRPPISSSRRSRRRAS